MALRGLDSNDLAGTERVVVTASGRAAQHGPQHDRTNDTAKELTRGEVVNNGVSLQTQLAERWAASARGSRELLVGTGKDTSSGVLIAAQHPGPGLNPETFDRLVDALGTTKPAAWAWDYRSAPRTIVSRSKSRHRANAFARPGPLGETHFISAIAVSNNLAPTARA